MWWTTIVGFGVGLVLSHVWIFPAHAVDMRLVNMTVGDLLRIFGGLVASVTAAGIGNLADIGFGRSD